MDDKTAKANLLLMDAKKLLETVRKSNSRDADLLSMDSFSMNSNLNSTPMSYNLKRMELNCQEENIVSPISIFSDSQQSEDDGVTVDSDLYSNDDRSATAEKITPINQPTLKILHNNMKHDDLLQSNAGEFINFVLSNTTVSIRPHRTHESEVKVPQTVLQSEAAFIHHNKVTEVYSTSEPTVQVKISSLSADQESELLFKSDDTTTTKTSETNRTSSCEDKSSLEANLQSNDKCHSPPNVNRRSSISTIETSSESAWTVRYLTEINDLLQQENMSLRKEMDDFHSKLSVLEHTLGIIQQVENTKVDIFDDHDDDLSLDDSPDEYDSDAFDTDCNIENIRPKSCNDHSNKRSSAAEEEKMSFRSPLGRLGNNKNPSVRNDKSTRNHHEIEKLRENNELMLNAIKSLHHCTVVHVRRHYDYKKILKNKSKTFEKAAEKLKFTETQLQDYTNKFYEYRSKFLMEQDKREALSQSVACLVNQMNDLRRVIKGDREEKQNMIQVLDKLCETYDSNDIEHITGSTCTKIHGLTSDLRRVKRKNQILEESLNTVRKYLSSGIENGC